MTKIMKQNSKMIPKEKEDRFLEDVVSHVDELLMSLSELEGDQTIKDDIAEGLGELSDIITSLVHAKGMPKRLKRYRNFDTMS